MKRMVILILLMIVPTVSGDGKTNPKYQWNGSLITAAKRGDLKGVKELLGKGASPDARDKWATALYYAVDRKHYEVVKYLLSKGANSVLANANGDLPLARAVDMGDRKMVETMLDAGARINAAASATALQRAAFNGHVDLVKLLLSRGASVHKRSKFRGTAVMTAVYNAKVAEAVQIEILSLLIARGARVNDACSEGDTPIMNAAQDGRLEVVRYLVSRGADIHRRDIRGMTALARAASLGRGEVVKYLVSKGAKVNLPKSSPVAMAAGNGHIEVVRFLIEKGADTEKKGRLAVPALMTACRGGYIEIVKLLVEKGSDVNIKSEYGSPLAFAVLSRKTRGAVKIEMIKYLLSKGAEINPGKRAHITPLNAAVCMHDLELVRYLAEKGADVNLPDRYGHTPLIKTADRGCHHNKSWENFDREYARIAEFLLDRGAELHRRNRDGKTALMLAKLYGYKEVQTVLEKAVGEN